MDVVAYYRVSTKGQGESGLGIEAQRTYVQMAAKQQGWNVVAEYTDTVSGTIAPVERPECRKALSHGLPIVAAKIDRISRSVLHIAQLMEQVDFKIATMPMADRFQLHLYAALAEQERQFISQRTKDALQALQERADSGCVVSKEKVNRRSDNLVRARKAKQAKAAQNVDAQTANPHQAKLAPHVMAALYKGVSTLQALADALNGQALFTSRGGEWSPTTVRRLMMALDVNFKKG
ncbi:TPA: recombinase family protein [Pseudomonas putida]|uniref:recombinase family protein n=1 Tax=Pseudomonas putida TaxID=303 RepID=UPI00330AC827|nr:recombinase family protein [Pseudomonas putida]